MGTTATTNRIIETLDPQPRKRVRVVDTEMSYVDIGHGEPIVFLHGNPTWSFLWRNVIPHVADLGRCLAPDLVGMGRSGKSPARAYRLVDHARYLDAWFDKLALRGNITLVVHDWGSVLGFNRARRHADHIKAIIYMEAIALPRRWEDYRDGRDKAFRMMRSEEGEHRVLDENYFVEKVLPGRVLRRLSDDEMAAYRAPFPDRASRLPTLVWPRELPIDGAPADVVETVQRCGDWMARSDHPKLFINAEPGSLLTGRFRDFCRTWHNQQEVTVRGDHFVQEDSPAEIGAAARAFLRSLG
jgi:haloalkane dehalogenase